MFVDKIYDDDLIEIGILCSFAVDFMEAKISVYNKQMVLTRYNVTFTLQMLSSVSAASYQRGAAVVTFKGGGGSRVPFDVPQDTIVFCLLQYMTMRNGSLILHANREALLIERSNSAMPGLYNCFLRSVPGDPIAR